MSFVVLWLSNDIHSLLMPGRLTSAPPMALVSRYRLGYVVRGL